MEKAKKIRSIVAGCLAAVSLATAGLAVATNGFKSFKKNDNIQMELPEEDNGGAVVGEGTGNGVKLMTAKIASEDYADYGISPMAETAYTITATITPSNATNKVLDWSVSFENPDSAWASGKTVTDYVTITPTSDGALTATLQNLKAFGEPIIVKANSREFPDISATATCDYVKRIESLSVAFSADLDFQTEYTVSVEPVYSTGTLDGELTISGGDFALTEGFKDAVKADMSSTYANSFTYKDAVYEFNAETLIFEFTELNPALSFIKPITLAGDKKMEIKVRNAYNNSFGVAVVGYEEPHATFTITYSYEYNEEVYSSGEASVDLKFDAEAFTVSVVDVTLNDSHFVF